MQFQTDLPAILDALRDRIDAAYADNPGFRVTADTFLAHAKGKHCGSGMGCRGSDWGKISIYDFY